MSPYSGSIKLTPEDFNKDSGLYFKVLTAQGKEEISLYDNQGNGIFFEESSHKSLQVYGISYFMLPNMNAYGIRDLVVAARDNVDYLSVLKP